MIEIETEVIGSDEAIVRVAGEVDMNRSDELREVLGEAAEGGMQRVTVDLEGVEFIDSSGIATLVEAQQVLRRQGGTLVLRNLREHVRSVFEIANLLDVFTVE